jgi:hypothetical protein
MALIEVKGCIYDEGEFRKSHGYESFDPVGREAFVNHIHLEGTDRETVATSVIALWTTEMCSRWPTRTFRIYRQVETDEVTIRFHMVRPDWPNWCEDGIEIITVCGANTMVQ